MADGGDYDDGLDPIECVSDVSANGCGRRAPIP